MQSFDHVPTPEDLLKSIQEAEEQDPRSVFYKRVLVRPKLPLGWILLNLAVCVAVCLGAWWLLGLWAWRVAWKLVGCLGLLLLLHLLFAKKWVILAVKVYQALAPEKLRRRCRYEPSCSGYMILALEKYGFFKGLAMGLKRWKGCKPPNGGFDLP